MTMTIAVMIEAVTGQIRIIDIGTIAARMSAILHAGIGMLSATGTATIMTAQNRIGVLSVIVTGMIAIEIIDALNVRDDALTVMTR